ncbi:MAG: flagellar basal body rod protein FlgB [Alphaproteobacteria bacterium]
MDFSQIPLFQAITKKMGWLGQRQQVLARNIANINTPGYKPKDLTAPDFGAILRGSGSGAGAPAGGGVPLVATHRAHFKAGPLEDTTAEREKESSQPDGPMRPNGNAVVMETELMKVNKTAMDYQLTTNIYRKYISMFHTALGRRG